MPLTRPTLPQLRDRVSSDFVGRLSLGPLMPRMVVKIIADVIAGAAHQLYGFIQWATRQLFPDTAEAEFLERWASIWGVQRNAATFSTGNITFTGTAGNTIPSGTLLLRADGVEFRTEDDATLSGSPATVTVGVGAAVAGSHAATPAGQTLTLVSPIAGVNATPTVAVGGIAGGADEEGDTSLRARLLTRIRQPPQGGAAYDYTAWALAVSGVTRAWVYPLHLGHGTVGVAVVADDADDGPIPSVQLVEDVQEYIDQRRPVTASVTVFTPIALPLELEIELTPDTSTVRQAIVAEVTDLLRREAVPGGTMYISKIREAISIAAGEDHHNLVAPVADIVCDTGELLVLGDITWI